MDGIFILYNFYFNKSISINKKTVLIILNNILVAERSCRFYTT